MARKIEQKMSLMAQETPFISSQPISYSVASTVMMRSLTLYSLSLTLVSYSSAEHQIAIHMAQQNLASSETQPATFASNCHRWQFSQYYHIGPNNRENEVLPVRRLQAESAPTCSCVPFNAILAASARPGGVAQAVRIRWCSSSTDGR